jgi:hypothetical protein
MRYSVANGGGRQRGGLVARLVDATHGPSFGVNASRQIWLPLFPTIFWLSTLNAMLRLCIDARGTLSYRASADDGQECVDRSVPALASYLYERVHLYKPLPALSGNTVT